MTLRPSLLFLVATVISVLYTEKAYSFCGTHDSGYHRIVEVSHLVERICSAERGSGATIRLKSAILIFPDPFFLRVPWGYSISLGLPTILDDSAMQVWEFGGIQIGRDDDEIFSAAKANADVVNYPVVHSAAAQCNESITLSKGLTERPIVGRKRDVYFLSMQEHTIRGVGDVRALMLALVDSYSRLNCE